ncbi:glutamate decarboxylase [Ranunculus cassubicifolius]
MVISTTATEHNASLNSIFASRYVRTTLPRYKMPEDSIPKEAAYQIISDELMLDGNPRLNLASFVTTWMEPECDKLMMDAINKNYVDMDEYAEISNYRPHSIYIILDTNLYVLVIFVVYFVYGNVVSRLFEAKFCNFCSGSVMDEARVT